MPRRSRFFRSALTATTLAAGYFPVSAAVEFRRLPDGGMQPRLVVAADQSVHMVWLGGDPKASDVFYRHHAPDAAPSGTPVRINSQPGSAIAIGTIRGAQVAVGRDGRAHVVWNGSGTATPKPAGSAPLLYARSDPAGTAFEPQRNLVTRTTDLDGGGSVAADADGRVNVLWHAGTPGTKTSEDKRRVFLARSTDDGRSFAPETPVTDGTGACGCCGMEAVSGPGGEIFALYRSAKANVHREATLAVSRDHGVTFTVDPLQDWETGSCPMSSAAFLGSKTGMTAAWETQGRIHFSAVGKGASKPIRIESAPGAKHPALAVNAKGEMLVAWTEGTGWQRGGNLAWQVFDAAGKPTPEHGSRPGIPIWSYAAAYARTDGTFVIVY